jgi:hypothetical protein
VARLPRIALVAAGAVAVVAASAAATGLGVGKKTLGGRGWATEVTFSFTAPPGYRVIGGRGYENWEGPLWKSSVTGSEDESNLHFDVHPDYSTRSAVRAAQSKIGTDMGGIPTKQVAAGPIEVPHIVGGRKVGVIKGFFVIRQATQEQYEGWFEAALAVSLGKGYPIPAADVDTTSPDSDASKTIKGMLPSQWNRQVVEQGLRGIAVEGNLAPARLSVRVLGRRVVGQAADVLGHPVVGAKVTLAKPGGRACCSTKTTATGRYTLVVPASAGTGTFVVSVSVAEAVAKKTVTVR